MSGDLIIWSFQYFKNILVVFLIYLYYLQLSVSFLASQENGEN